MTAAPPFPIRVFLPCTGLGRVQRGFEAFTRECGEVLGADRRLDVVVFGGGGDLRPGERETWNLPRDHAAARAVGALTGYDPYFIEQASFFAGFVPALALQKPNVVYFGDINLGNACWHWRRLTRQPFRLLYFNGGATTRPFIRSDAVQQVSPEHRDAAIARGESADRQILLPHGVHIPREYQPCTADERRRIRAELGVPADRPVVLCVSALQASQKRLDHVIAEVATMPSEPHLLLLGADTPESGLVRSMANDRLPGRCTIRTVSRDQARAAYRAADAFALGSLREGFGLAVVEAMAAGLPCVTHDTPTMEYLMGPFGTRADLTFAGTLAALLERALAEGPARAVARHRHVWERFSWDVLAPRYAEMLIAVAAGRTPALPTV